MRRHENPLVVWRVYREMEWFRHAFGRRAAWRAARTLVAYRKGRL